MKYFVCALDSISHSPTSLGFPAEHTERIIPAGRLQSSVYETENDEVFISIPVLFKLKDNTAPHGLVLKASRFVRTVLLTPKIDVELEIPKENIHPLPEALAEKL